MADETETAEAVDPQWRESLMHVMRQAVLSLPDEATLGELIEATEKNSQLRPLLRHMSVQELLEMAGSRPAAQRVAEGPQFDEDGNPVMDLDGSPQVIRRRADVPDGDEKILEYLADNGASSESAVGRGTRLTSEQVRLLLRSLRTRGHVHVEGSGQKRRIKITRAGSSWLRRQRRAARR